MKHKEGKGPCITVWEWPDERGHLNRNKTVWLWVHPGDVKTLAHHPTNQGDIQKIQARQEKRVPHTCFPFHHTRGPAGHALKERLGGGVGV